MAEDTNVQYLDEKSYAAKYDRQIFRDILTEGIIGINDLKVTQLDTPDMGVKVAKGRALIQGDQSEWQGHYGITNDASKTLTIETSDPTNPRKDRIIAQIYDSIDIGGEEDGWVLEVLTGTPAPSPSAPALPDDALDLAIIDVGANVTEIINANITDQRVQIVLQNAGIKIDVISEKTSGVGVTIDGILLKDNLDTSGIVDKTTAQTLTNKRNIKRVVSIESSATPTPNGDITDVYKVTALAVAAEFGAPTGTPTDCQTLVIRIKDAGVAKALTWNAIYVGIGVTLPTTTVAGKRLLVGFIYNSVSENWECPNAVAQEG